MKMHKTRFIKDTTLAKKVHVDGSPVQIIFKIMFIKNANPHDMIIKTPGDS